VIKFNLLDILAFCALFSGILVITSKNPVISIVYLVLLFLFISLILILIGIKFIGLSYIIVYIGAISVLFLFIIMMININLIDILEIGKDYTKNIPLAFILGILFAYSFFTIIPNFLTEINIELIQFDYFNYLNHLFTNIIYMLKLTYSSIISYNSAYYEISINQFSQVKSLGLILYTKNGLLLIIISMILLISMVALIFISRK
jgi:NADH-ubiquinone oxidoreductase chain 6